MMTFAKHYLLPRIMIGALALVMAAFTIPADAALAGLVFAIIAAVAIFLVWRKPAFA